MLKTVFFGTPAVAVPFLEKLAKISDLRGVVTGPDRPVGRGYALTPPPVKTAAQALGCSVEQPEKLSNFSLDVFGPGLDLGLVVAYGRLIPSTVFRQPRAGLVNVHFSLLPRLRGAAPMQWALIRGERETGVTLFQIEAGLDTGPVFQQKALPIDSTDNAVTLREKLIAVGLSLEEALVRSLEAGPVVPVPQVGTPTQAPALKKEDGNVDWARSAAEIHNLIRGAYEWPGAWTRLKGARLRLRGAEPLDGEGGTPGRVVSVEKGRGFLVQCGSGRLRITRVQPEGKREMDADSFWNGARLAPGEVFE